MNKTDNMVAMAKVVASLQKEFGEDSLMILGEAKPAEVNVIPTGCPSIDTATGVGGFPRGRIVEVFGKESSGKTTLGYTLVAKAQKMGLGAGYLDFEHSCDLNYASHIGVDVGSLAFSQPSEGNKAMDLLLKMARSGAFGILVVDSVAAIRTTQQLEGEAGDANIASVARVMSDMMPKIAAAASETDTLVCFINQIRINPATMYGSPEYTPGGSALPFYATIRADMRRIGGVGQGKASIGNKVRIRFKKNKVARPYTEAEFEILFGEGITSKYAIIDLALEKGVLEKKGSWFYYGGEKIGQGREKTLENIESDKELKSEVESLCEV